MPYLIKPDESLSLCSVNDDVLDLAVSSELGMNVFFFHRLTQTLTPNTFCWAGLCKGQLQSCRASNSPTVQRPDGLTHADNVHELHRRIATLLDVDLEDFAERRELVVQVVGGNIARQVPNVERPGRFRVKLVQISIGWSVI